ncbi:MAG TPA: hypothetical protein PLJ21_05715 [Pseudobdellovibrionaceae bacterium]|nr:hypothetical protein [Pseudobdellovibrionaceae bacterium]
MNSFEPITNKIINYFVENPFKEELADAKKYFFENAGILDERSEAFDQRMKQFYDWYLFTRNLKGFAQTPLESCFDVRALRLNEEELIQLDKLKLHRHSLFEFIKVKEDDVYVRDLLNDKKYIVRKSPWIFGFAPKEIFEARLVPLGETYEFMKGLCFHPSQAYKYILGEIKILKKTPDLDPDEFILRLCKMRYQMDQYRHISPEMIYSNENKVQFKSRGDQ